MLTFCHIYLVFFKSILKIITNIMAFHIQICQYSSLKIRTFLYNHKNIITSNKITNNSLISSNTQPILKYSQLYKCLFNWLIQTKIQSRTMHWACHVLLVSLNLKHSSLIKYVKNWIYQLCPSCQIPILSIIIKAVVSPQSPWLPPLELSLTFNNVGNNYKLLIPQINCIIKSLKFFLYIYFSVLHLWFITLIPILPLSSSSTIQHLTFLDLFLTCKMNEQFSAGLSNKTVSNHMWLFIFHFN